jgi:protoheme IX farnesyltransferase
MVACSCRRCPPPVGSAPMSLPIGASRSTSVPAGTNLSAQMASKARAYLALTKPRIIELLLVTTLPTMFVARRGIPSVSLMALTMVGGALAAGGANAFNMVLDRDIDKLMHRTQNRPLVTGEMTPVRATIFASLLEVGAFLELWRTVNLISAVLAVSATAFYVVVYTILLKRTSSQNIVIGGAAGAVPVLVGWTAVTGHLSWAPIVLFLVIFIWTPPHFWSLAIRYREDYAAANVPMLPVVATFKRTARQIVLYSVLLVACTLFFAAVGHMGPLYIAAAVLLGAGFIVMAIRLQRQTSERAAMAMFRYSITYLTLLFAAMAADVVIRHP